MKIWSPPNEIKLYFIGGKPVLGGVSNETAFLAVLER